MFYKIICVVRELGKYFLKSSLIKNHFDLKFGQINSINITVYFISLEIIKKISKTFICLTFVEKSTERFDFREYFDVVN